MSPGFLEVRVSLIHILCITKVFPLNGCQREARSLGNFLNTVGIVGPLTAISRALIFSIPSVRGGKGKSQSPPNEKTRANRLCAESLRFISELGFFFMRLSGLTK